MQSSNILTILPFELLSHVASFVSNRRTLKAFSATCHVLRRAAIPYLFKAVKVVLTDDLQYDFEHEEWIFSENSRLSELPWKILQYVEEISSFVPQTVFFEIEDRETIEEFYEIWETLFMKLAKLLLRKYPSIKRIRLPLKTAYSSCTGPDVAVEVKRVAEHYIRGLGKSSGIWEPYLRFECAPFEKSPLHHAHLIEYSMDKITMKTSYQLWELVYQECDRSRCTYGAQPYWRFVTGIVFARQVVPCQEKQKNGSGKRAKKRTSARLYMK